MSHPVARPMIHTFPSDRALLPRTKLAYANLPGILADGKRDRQARVPGFVAIQLGERCHLILLRNAEPFFGATVTEHDRSPTALSEILRTAETECERGEGGTIGFYAASEEQLRAMACTIAHAPLPLPPGADTTSAERLFPVLRERAFTGILELTAADGAHHYLSFRRGAYREGWFVGRKQDAPVADLIRSLFDGTPPRPALYPLLETLPVHASPGLIDQYRRVLSGAVRELAQTVGTEEASALMESARRRAAEEHPCVARMMIGPGGRLDGDPVATPEDLTAAVADWLTEALSGAAEEHGIDPGPVMERVARDGRYVLQEHGFFARLPWAVAL